MPVSCAKVLCQGSLLTALVNLLHTTQTKISADVSSTASGGPGSSSAAQSGLVSVCRWLAPLLLLLDVWEKTLVMANWTRTPKKVNDFCLGMFDCNDVMVAMCVYVKAESKGCVCVCARKSFYCNP